MRKNKLYIITFILTIILIFSTASIFKLCGMPVEIETEKVATESSEEVAEQEETETQKPKETSGTEETTPQAKQVLDISFSTKINDDSSPIEADTQFPISAEKIFASVKVKNIGQEDSIKIIWNKGNEEVFEESFSPEAEIKLGYISFKLYLSEIKEQGKYKAKVFLNGKEVLSEDLYITEATEDITTEETEEEAKVETKKVTQKNKSAPTIELRIYEGPTHSAADDVCLYRIEAVVTGSPTPTVSFSRDDSGGAWGFKKVQINLKRNSPTYTLTATATNSSGSASDSINLTWGCGGDIGVSSSQGVASGSNNAPLINNLTASNISPLIGQTIKVTADASDPDGDTLSYIWNAQSGSISGSGKEINWKAPNLSGNYKISLKVEDGKGGSVTKDLTISVKSISYLEPTEPEIIVEPINLPPVLTDVWRDYYGIKDRSPIYVSVRQTFKVYAEGYDPDGDIIIFGSFKEYC